MIEAKQLCKSVGGRYPPIDDVSFFVERGESYCLLGAKDSGTSTLVEVFRSVVWPTSGQAVVNGLDCQSQPLDVRRHILFVTQSSALVASLSLRDNVSFFVRISGRRVSRDVVDNALRRFAVPEAAFDIAAREVDRKELLFLTWLAIASVRGVPVLVLGEPTEDLDTRGVEWVVEGVREIQSAGATVLMATSDARFATALGARVGVLRAGRKDAEYRPGEIADENVGRFYLDYLGRPSGAAAPSQIV